MSENTFQRFGFSEKLLEGIESVGYETPTPIQQQAIPVILQGRDLIGSAQTGTGKTAAFLLPVIQKITSQVTPEAIKAVIIVPTRELAVQIDQICQGLSYFTPVNSIPVYGGTDGTVYSREQMAIRNGVDILICTPGRFISHLNLGYVDLSALQFLILDEADRMLDMGFIDDILKIISYLPEKRQTLMFSATMPDEIRKLAKRILKNPAEINLGVSTPVAKIVQTVYHVPGALKNRLIKHILIKENLRSVLVFCSTKQSTKQLAQELKRAGLPVAEIHSDLEQKVREETLIRFKCRELAILVATDILSRGIDIDNIDMVINFDVPNDGEEYIHRIGRTARAEAEGKSVTLITEQDTKKFARIEKMLGYKVNCPDLPEELGPAEFKQVASEKPHRKKRFRDQRKRTDNPRKKNVSGQ